MCPSVLTGFAIKTIVPKKVFNESFLLLFCFLHFFKVRRIIKINHFFSQKNPFKLVDSSGAQECGWWTLGGSLGEMGGLELAVVRA